MLSPGTVLSLRGEYGGALLNNGTAVNSIPPAVGMVNGLWSVAIS